MTTASLIPPPTVAQIVSHAEYRVRVNHTPNWQAYETAKREIVAANLSPAEYERAIRELCKALGL